MRLACALGVALLAFLGATSCSVNDVTSTESGPADEARTSGDTSTPAEAVRPFEIAVPQLVLDDLQERLARTRFPDEIEGAVDPRLRVFRQAERARV